MWLAINERYSVSDDGFVMNLLTGKILKNHDDRRGYDRVDIGGKHRKVHRLVAERFLPAPTQEGLVVDHIDRNKRNNNASNLRWVTQSVNVLNRSPPVCSRCANSS